MAASTLPIEAVAIFAGIGLFLVAAGLREGYRAVALWRQRPVPVGELDRASGRVLVVGTAQRLDRTVTAPVTGTECLAYTWRSVGLETTFGPGSIERSGHQLDSGRGECRFRLSDYSGSIVVDPRGASLRLTEEHVEDPVSDPTRQRGFSLDIDAHHLYESRLDEGETVVVQGTLTDTDETSIDANRLGRQLSGGGLYVADTTQDNAMRRTRRSAAVSLTLGLLVLAGLAVLLGVLPP